jgi:DNA replication protein DnaC
MTEWASHIGIPKICRDTAISVALVPDLAKTWAEKLPESARVAGGMLLAGPPGSGKSFTAAWMLLELYRRCWFTADGQPVGPWERIGARFIRCHDVTRAAVMKDFAQIRTWWEPDVLVLDDWPDGLPAWLVLELTDLLDRRHVEQRFTIVTTNILCGKPDETDTFETNYSRAASRLLDARGPGLVVLNRGDLRR